MSEKVSAILITRNNAHEIERCLESIRWVDEIVVIDTFSTDDTVAICQRRGARVYQQEFRSFHTQVNDCLAHTTHDWTLNLFADETVTPELRDEIRALLAEGPRCNGYQMPRRTWFHGRCIRWGGYYPSPHLRLWRKSKGRYRLREPHLKVGVEGRVGRLRGALDHWCWQRPGEFLDNLVEYARVEARWRYEVEGRRVRPHHFLDPPWHFFRRFILRLGFLDGTMGFVLAARPACERFLRIALQWELQNEARLRARGGDPAREPAEMGAPEAP